MRYGRIFAAEVIGTAVLMLGGPGSAILAGKEIGLLGVSLAFGFSLLIMAYAIGNISGCHINPAVTIGLWLARKIDTAKVLVYIVAQAIGAAIGGLLIYLIANDQSGFDATNNFAANGWDSHSPSGYSLTATIVVEIVFTAILVFVVLATTHRQFSAVNGGLMVGLALALIHLVTIPIDNTSVNPARSFGAAIFAGSDALGQLWAFIVFPIVGAIVGVLAWLAVDEGALEGTRLGQSQRVLDVRDKASGAVGKVGEKIENVGQRTNS